MYVRTVFRRSFTRLICYSAVAGIILSSGHASAEIRGLYKSPLGLLKLSEKNGVVRARQYSRKGPCGFKKGKVIFEGSRLDDSLTGDLRTCRVGPNCTGEINGMAMLLVSPKGKVISGAVHVGAGECATPLRGDSIRLTKRKRSAKKKKKVRSRENPNQSAAETHASIDSTKSDASSDRGSDKRTAESKNQSAGPVANPGGETGAARATEGSKAIASEPIIERSPEEKRAIAQNWAQKAAGFLGTGNAEKARELFQTSVETDPEYSQGYVGLGITYYQRDRYEEALEQYKKAVEVNPSNPDAYYNMACIYSLQNEDEQAINFLRISLLNGYVDLDTIQEDSSGDFKNLSNNKDFKKIMEGRFD